MTHKHEFTGKISRISGDQVAVDHTNYPDKYIFKIINTVRKLIGLGKLEMRTEFHTPGMRVTKGDSITVTLQRDN